MKIQLVWLIAICLSFTSFADSKDWNLRVNEFAQSPEWLGHFFYQPEWKGYSSPISSAGYFLSPIGKTDPEAELRATIVGLETKDYCKFIGRFELVLSQFPELKKPYHLCPVFESWMSKLSIDQVRLSFASGYMKNPASSFGHLFLKLKSETQPSELLNYGINFAAYTGEDNGVEYALKGLLGDYPGTFSFLPYHQLIKDYSDLEGRDIWEVNLDLTQGQIRKLLAFIYEFDGHHIEYTFLNQNCAGILEDLILAIKGQTKSKWNKPWRMPLESFLQMTPNTESSKRFYVPSLKTQQRNLERYLTIADKNAIKRQEETKDFSQLTTEALDYILLDKKLDTSSEVEKNYYNQILVARSRLPLSKDFQKLKDEKFQIRKTSIVKLVNEDRHWGVDLAFLSDRIIYGQNLSEIRILDIEARKNQLLKINFFEFLASETITFLRQPLSFGGGLAYQESVGIVATLQTGLLYKNGDWIYFPKLRLSENRFSPEIDLYFFSSWLNLRWNLNAYQTEIEIIKHFGTNNFGIEYVSSEETKLHSVSINIGRFF